MGRPLVLLYFAVARRSKLSHQTLYCPSVVQPRGFEAIRPMSASPLALDDPFACRHIVDAYGIIYRITRETT